MEQPFLADGNSLGHSMKIKDMPISSRPREKAFICGISSLTNQELLALLIGSGVQNCSALDIAKQILDDNLLLTNLAKSSLEHFCHYKGVKKASALRLSACFELAGRMLQENIVESEEIDEEYLFKRYRYRLGKLNDERLVLVILDRRKRLVKELTIASGLTDRVIYQPKTILKELVLANGFQYYLLHNHPSGEVKPSKEDIIFSLSLMSETLKFGIKMVDHLVITSNSYCCIVKGFINKNRNRTNKNNLVASLFSNIDECKEAD